MSKKYSVKYVIWTEENDLYSDKEFTYSSEVDYDEGIMMAETLIDMYTIDHEGYERFRSSGRQFRAFRKKYTEHGYFADGIRVWIE